MVAFLPPTEMVSLSFLLPNLCINEHISHGSAALSIPISLSPLVARFICSPTSLKPFSICLSNSSRSVMITTRASSTFSRIHCANHIIVSDLPEPCECQIMPFCLLRTRGCAALMAKYWLGRAAFLTPPSKIMKS